MHFGRQRADGVANLGFLAFNARSACTQAAGALHATHGSDMAEALCTSLVHGAVDAKDIKHEVQSILYSLSAAVPATKPHLQHNAGKILQPSCAETRSHQPEHVMAPLWLLHKSSICPVV